ncbi:uncharacterized protein MELLADRAFT_85140 [Melampsora larici-populina 98AG31]|uniref:GCM domain-containing protein n=1 Tax=Melampsora larici-populina (strain 98AG31 / pathotype 3-4-7) TaxID=747676 RepID=F4RHM8_MELLP|nr:uncharacterized protein MELLADRAFT_85140 [Melampsora larici-populina 98AG31]EGG07853.1 hypothetical protein MELLADRAFT_85140 [Melampsora larici-populina 98AG31]
MGQQPSSLSVSLVSSPRATEDFSASSSEYSSTGTQESTLPSAGTLETTVMKPTRLEPAGDDFDLDVSVKSDVSSPFDLDRHVFRNEGQDDQVEAPSQRRPQLQLPGLKSQYRNFIDHGSQVDAENYPTYPNGDTVFVKEAKDIITNWQFIGWTHKMRVSTTKNKQWKTRTYACLGVMECSEPTCQFAGPPPTGQNKISDVIESTCKGIQTHYQCDCKCRIDTEIDINKKEGWALLRHRGVHKHVWPDAKKADPLAKAKLKEAVVNDPKTGPLGLKVGRVHLGTQPIKSISELHPSFGHIDRLGYLRREFLAEAGLMPSKDDPEAGDKWLQSIQHWANRGLDDYRQGMQLISVSCLTENFHYSLQTDWMAEVLLYKYKGETYSGGLLSDVTYRFFQNGYLLTTSMYVEQIGRWVPILLTWLAGLDTGHYKAHFMTLFERIQKTTKSDKEKRLLCEQVVDFSLAQKNGFVEAYMEVFQVNEVTAMSKLHGCLQHFRQAVMRLQRNHTIVPVHLEELWAEKCAELLLPDGPDLKTLDERFEELRTTFPKAKKWLDWWCTSDIQAMLFPARKRMPEDDPPLDESDDEDVTDQPRRRRNLPATTNAQESMHRVYYVLCPGKCELIPGLVQLFALVQSLERDYRQVAKGIPIAYGTSQKNWEEVVKTLGMPKPTKRRYVPNDGRAPDTTKELIGTGGKKKGPGRPKGSQNVIRHPLTTYQSYTCGTTLGTKNRCWQSSVLECLYALYGPGWSKYLTVNGTRLVNLLMRHFTSRFRAELTEGSGLKGVLSRGQGILHRAIEDQKNGYFIADQFACADSFFEKFLQQKSPMRPLFEIPLRKTSTCSRNVEHNRTSLVSMTTLHVLPHTFHNAGISYGDAELLIERWTTTGLSTTAVCSQCHPHETLAGSKQEDLATMERRFQLEFPDTNSAPLHLYIHLDGVVELTNHERESFMGNTNWPAHFSIGNINYKMIARGFWAASHYWCQVVRCIQDVMGVWHYDELKNGGFAQLIERDITKIGGPIPHTSWICYTRMPNDSEVQETATVLRGLMKQFPTHTLTIPFSMPTERMPFGGGLPPLVDEKPEAHLDIEGSVDSEGKEDQLEEIFEEDAIKIKLKIPKKKAELEEMPIVPVQADVSPPAAKRARKAPAAKRPAAAKAAKPPATKKAKKK